MDENIQNQVNSLYISAQMDGDDQMLRGDFDENVIRERISMLKYLRSDYIYFLFYLQVICLISYICIN